MFSSYEIVNSNNITVFLWFEKRKIYNDLRKIKIKLNKIELTIDFTYKLETNNTFPFLDISLIDNNNKLEFKVHHKATNKNYHIPSIFLYMYISP